MVNQQLLRFLLPLLLLYIVSAQSPCAKIDFNRTGSNAFRECNQLPALAIKDYSTNNLPKYRPTSRYFLGTNFNEFSCIELTDTFSLNPDSYIEAPVYFKSDTNAYISITVYDMDRNIHGEIVPVYSWRSIDSTGVWSMAHIDIESQIINAQIVIKTFMSLQSFVAVEYIHILNKAIYNWDCMKMNMPVANIKSSFEEGVQQGLQQGQQGAPGQPTRPPSQQGPQQGQQWPQQGQQGAPWQPMRPPGQQGPQQGWNGAPGQPTRPPSQQGPQQGALGQMYPTKPPGEQGHNNPNAINSNESLIAILVLSAISVASIILIGLYYCFVGSKQKGANHCTK